MYGSWDIQVWQTEFFVILDHFLHFYPSIDPENQNFKKIKKTPGDIIILHRCAIYEDHMMYSYWDMEHNRQNVLSFWTIFYPFTFLTTWKIKIFKKWKKTWRYYHLKQVHHKWQSYDVCFLRYCAWQTEFFVILDQFLPFYPPNNPRNNFEKLKKMPRDVIILHMCTINVNYMMYGSWDMKCDGQNFLSFWIVFALLPP